MVDLTTGPERMLIFNIVPLLLSKMGLLEPSNIHFRSGHQGYSIGHSGMQFSIVLFFLRLDNIAMYACVTKCLIFPVKKE